ncbi:OadG family transporter subunit [Thalassotalea fusca]
MNSLSQLFVEAGTLMIAGMIFVFAFLGLLVLFINLVLAKLAVAFPDPVVPTKTSQRNNKANRADTVSPNVVAAIGAAVNQYRQKHVKKK